MKYKAKKIYVVKKLAVLSINPSKHGCKICPSKNIYLLVICSLL